MAEILKHSSRWNVSLHHLLYFFSQILTSVQTTPIIVMSMLIVTIPWGPLIARVTLDTQETEQHVLVKIITLFSIEVLLFIFHTLLAFNSRLLDITEYVLQRHPTTASCNIYVRRSKYCLKFSITWGRLKISRWPFHSWTIFKAYLINSLRFSKA